MRELCGCVVAGLVGWPRVGYVRKDKQHYVAMTFFGQCMAVQYREVGLAERDMAFTVDLALLCARHLERRSRAWSSN